MSLRFILRMMWASGPSAFGQKNEKKDPNEILEELETWSARATLVIFSGIALEILAIWYIPKDFCKDLVDSIADGLIGVGLIIEYFCIRNAILHTRASNRLSEQKIAEAHARIKEAELIIRQREPRELDKAAFKEAISSAPKSTVEIFFLRFDNEAYSLALQIREALIEAEWSVLDVAAKTADELCRCIPLAHTLSVRIVHVARRMTTLKDRLTVASTIRLLGTPATKSNSFAALFKAVSSIKGGGWTGAIHGSDPKQIDAPAAGVFRVIIGPHA